MACSGLPGKPGEPGFIGKPGSVGPPGLKVGTCLLRVTVWSFHTLCVLFTVQAQSVVELFYCENVICTDWFVDRSIHLCRVRIQRYSPKCSKLRTDCKNDAQISRFERLISPHNIWVGSSWLESGFRFLAAILTSSELKLDSTAERRSRRELSEPSWSSVSFVVSRSLA